MKQGDTADAMYIVLEGAVSITIGAESAEQQEVAISAAGDVVGEMSLMTGRAAHRHGHRADPGARVRDHQGGDRGFVQDHAELLERFSRVLAQRQLENESLAARRLDKGAVENDILAKMRNFFSRAFGLS